MLAIPVLEIPLATLWLPFMDFSYPSIPSPPFSSFLHFFFKNSLHHLSKFSGPFTYPLCLLFSPLNCLTPFLGTTTEVRIFPFEIQSYFRPAPFLQILT